MENKNMNKWKIHCGSPSKDINIEISAEEMKKMMSISIDEVDNGKFISCQQPMIPVTIECSFRFEDFPELYVDNNRFFKTLPKMVSEKEMKIVREKGIKRVYYFYDDKVYIDES
jgi:hypothetical protein